MSKKSLLEQKKEQYEGKVYPTKTSGELAIVEYISSVRVLIRFLNTGNERFTRIGDINKREVRDKEAFPVYSFGIMDVPKELNMVVGKPREYIIWNAMRQRCYNENTRKAHESYKNVEISDYFKRYSNFKIWCNNQIGFNIEGFELDKDVLVKGNRIYSENTCCFIPKEINILLTSRRKARGACPVGVSYKKRISKYVSQISKYGEVIHLGCFKTQEEAFSAYKKAKEAYIKDVANKWKEQIDPRVYDALMNWTIEITD